MKILKTIFFAGIYLFLLPGVSLSAGLPVRISVKFILNPADGSRPCCTLRFDDVVRTRVAYGNNALGNSQNLSELRIDLVEIQTIGGLNNPISTQWFNADIVASIDGLKAAAEGNPTDYKWIWNAINVYINEDTVLNAGGVALMPPHQNIFMVNQRAPNNVFIHELGHNLNLNHTFELGGDGCDDTITDPYVANSTPTPSGCPDGAGGFRSCTRNDIVAANPSATAAQVDIVWLNVMSYHNMNISDRFSSCQLDRMSRQGYSDNYRTMGWIIFPLWYYTARPIYVNSGFTGTSTGSFDNPYTTLQGAFSDSSGSIIVLQNGPYSQSRISGTTNKLNLVPRGGRVRITPVPVHYLPLDLPKLQARADLHPIFMRMNEAAEKDDTKKGIESLQELEQYAEGDEKIAVHYILGDNYSVVEDYESAIKYWNIVGEEAKDLHTQELSDPDIKTEKKERLKNNQEQLKETALYYSQKSSGELDKKKRRENLNKKNPEAPNKEKEGEKQ